MIWRKIGVKWYSDIQYQGNTRSAPEVISQLNLMLIQQIGRG